MCAGMCMIFANVVSPTGLFLFTLSRYMSLQLFSFATFSFKRYKSVSLPVQFNSELFMVFVFLSGYYTNTALLSNDIGRLRSSNRYSTKRVVSR